MFLHGRTWMRVAVGMKHMPAMFLHCRTDVSAAAQATGPFESRRCNMVCCCTTCPHCSLSSADPLQRLSNTTTSSLEFECTEFVSPYLF